MEEFFYKKEFLKVSKAQRLLSVIKKWQPAALGVATLISLVAFIVTCVFSVDVGGMFAIGGLFLTFLVAFVMFFVMFYRDGYFVYSLPHLNMRIKFMTSKFYVPPDVLSAFLHKMLRKWSKYEIESGDNVYKSLMNKKKNIEFKIVNKEIFALGRKRWGVTYPNAIGGHSLIYGKGLLQEGAAGYEFHLHISNMMFGDLAEVEDLALLKAFEVV